MLLLPSHPFAFLLQLTGLPAVVRLSRLRLHRRSRPLARRKYPHPFEEGSMLRVKLDRQGNVLFSDDLEQKGHLALFGWLFGEV